MTAPLTPALLAEMEARAAAATPGPWRESSTVMPGPDALKVWAPYPEGIAGLVSELCVLIGNRHKPNPADVSFAAHARQDVEDLVAEVRRLGKAGAVDQKVDVLAREVRAIGQWLRLRDDETIGAFANAFWQMPAQHGPACSGRRDRPLGWPMCSCISMLSKKDAKLAEGYAQTLSTLQAGSRSLVKLVESVPWRCRSCGASIRWQDIGDDGGHPIVDAGNPMMCGPVVACLDVSPQPARVVREPAPGEPVCESCGASVGAAALKKCWACFERDAAGGGA